MKLKLDKDGNVVVVDGKPVYVIEKDGKQEDLVYDAPLAMSKITALNAEAKTSREGLEAATAKLSAYGDIDPEAATKALETVKNLDDKTLIAAGEVDKVKAQLVTLHEKEKEALINATKVREQEFMSAAEESEGTIRHLLVSNAFNQSPYFSGSKPKTTMPAAVAASFFGDNFKVEGKGKDAKIVGYLGDEKILSTANFGGPATFDDCMGRIIEASAIKDQILPSTPGGPGGGGNTNFNTDGNFLTVSRADMRNPAKYDAIQAEAGKTGAAIKVVD